MPISRPRHLCGPKPKVTYKSSGRSRSTLSLYKIVSTDIWVGIWKHFEGKTYGLGNTLGSRDAWA